MLGIVATSPQRNRIFWRGRERVIHIADGNSRRQRMDLRHPPTHTPPNPIAAGACPCRNMTRASIQWRADFSLWPYLVCKFLRRNRFIAPLRRRGNESTLAADAREAVASPDVDPTKRNRELEVEVQTSKRGCHWIGDVACNGIRN